MTRVLIIEDEERTASEIVDALTEAELTPVLCHDGESGLAMALKGGFDVITLDRLLPGLDGLEVLSRLRAEGVTTPVLVVSALGEVDDRVRGLRAGGDDYLTKPFAFGELLARLDALVRRTQGEDAAATHLAVGDLQMDLRSRKVTRGTRAIALQPREFQLLEYLMRHVGQVVTRTMLLENVWDYHFDPQTNIVDVHISNLRQKIEIPGEQPLVRTVRGAGYMMTAEG